MWGGHTWLPFEMSRPGDGIIHLMRCSDEKNKVQPKSAMRCGVVGATGAQQKELRPLATSTPHHTHPDVLLLRL